MEAAYIHVVIVLHAAFAAVFFFLNRERPSRFARCFAWCWTIEAVRAAILLPQVHGSGAMREAWFAVDDSLCFVATALLLAGFADLFTVRLPRRLLPIYVVTGIAVVLVGRYVWPPVGAAAFALTLERARSYGVFVNLVAMFIPVAVVRVVIMGWLLGAWRASRLPGALIAGIFSIPYAVFALAVPIQFFFGDYHGDWVAFVWCIRVLGFSIGLVMLMLSLQQAAVEKSEAALAAAQALARLGSWEFSPLTNACQWSAEMFRLCGRDPAQGAMTRTEFATAIHPDDRESFVRSESAALTEQRPGKACFRFVRADGAMRWIQWQATPVRDAEGNAVRLVGTAQDVTERVRAENRIRHLNRVYAVLSEINQTIVRVPHPDKLFATACQVAVERGEFRMAWIGRLREDQRQLDVVAHAGASPDVVAILHELIGAESGGGGCSFTARALRTGQHAACNEIERDPDAISWRAEALRFGYRAMAAFPLSSRGRVFGTFNFYAGETGFFDADELRLLDGLAVDISFAVEVSEREDERRRAEEALQSSEERFRQLAENIREVFWLRDPRESKILYVSPTYESVFGRTCASLYAAPLSWQEALHPEDRAATIAGFARQTEGNYEQEFRIVRPDGSMRWVRSLAFPVRDGHGQVYRIAGVAEDVTERKEVEEQLRQSQKLEAIGRLSGGVAHDFNNLLTVIKGNLTLLAHAVRGGNASEFLADISEAADRAATLTQQLLTFSRRQVLRLHTVDLNVVVADVSRMLRRVVGEDITMEQRTSTEPLWVRADSGMLEQVLLNLVVNARDAMPHGGRLEIETSAMGADEVPPAGAEVVTANGFARLRVCDTGEGIPSEARPHIFEPFFTTKEAGKGTGLGLATVYGIVEQHGGWIGVDTEPGRGTTFTVLLPRVDPPVTTPAESKPPADSLPTPASETILLVEDEDRLRRLVQTVLSRHGYHVLVAESGVAARDLWQRHREKIDLVLTDLILPLGVRGSELGVQFQQEKPGVRVIYTTGYSPEIAGRDFSLPKGSEFLAKPFDLATLVSLVRQTLDAR